MSSLRILAKSNRLKGMIRERETWIGRHRQSHPLRVRAPARFSEPLTAFDQRLDQIVRRLSLDLPGRVHLHNSPFVHHDNSVS